MPSSTLSSDASSAYLNYLLKGIALDSLPSSLYIGLFTTTPSVGNSGGVEVLTSGTGYARQELPRNTSTWTGPGGTGTQEYFNTNQIEFPVPTSNWGTINGLAIYTAITGGTLIFVSTIATSKSVMLGDGAPRILPGQLKIIRSAC